VQSLSASLSKTQIKDTQHGPTVAFIWLYCVSSALLMMLICSHLLIFILLVYSLYSFVSEVTSVGLFLVSSFCDAVFLPAFLMTV